jgi:hypothetical protein
MGRKAIVGMRKFQVGALAVALAGGLTIAACGSAPAASKTSEKLMPQVQAAARSATSVHVTGMVTEGSQTVTMDVSLSGSSMAGSMAVNGATFYILSLNGKTFIKINAAFLQQIAKAPAGVCAAICGKYVEIPGASASQIMGSISMQQLMLQIFNNRNISSAASTGCVFSPATVNGQPVLQCHQAPYTVDVAAHGKPYLLDISGPHGEHIAFSDWNAATLPGPPPASQVISIPNLG